MKTNNKARKKLIPAAAMLAVSAAMLTTATYAWFTMNKEVSVTGMKVKAKAEGGLLVNEVASANDANWDDQATANALPGTALVPTSTTNGAKWFHASSKSVNDEAGATSGAKSENLAGFYEELNLAANTAKSAVSGTNAESIIYYVNGNGTDGYQEDSTDSAYYIKYKYYLKVSSNTDVTLGAQSGAQNVAIKEVKATINQTNEGTAGTATSADLDKSLRIGIAIGGKMYIYAPVYGESDNPANYFAPTGISNTVTEGVVTAQTLTNSEVAPIKGGIKTNTALTSLPKVTSSGTEVDVYVWYEGEDDNCQSDKVSDTLDNITIDMTFALETLNSNASAPTNNAFDLPSGT